LSEKELDEVRRKRMIYRSKQRGWLEADILLGSWAKEFVPKLTPKELDELDIVLQEETIDIYNFMSGKDELPERLKHLSVMNNLKNYALNKDMVGPSAYETIKREANLT
jgi:succinate dehydrogenase assembly factor 2